MTAALSPVGVTLMAVSAVLLVVAIGGLIWRGPR